MEYGVSTWLWTSPFTDDTLSLFPKIKEMGFSHVEIPVEDPSHFDAKLVARALEDFELKAIVCGVFGTSRDLTHDDPSYHDACFEYIKKCFEFCHEWGAHFLGGPMYAAVGKARQVPATKRKEEWTRAVNNLRYVCELAEGADLHIALEPLNRFESDLVNRAEDVVRLIEDIDHPRAGILLDSFHMTIEEKNLQEAVLQAGDKLIHVQVSENYRGTPGTGQTRWEDLKKGLDAVGYDGVISIESFTPEVKELAGAVCVWRPLAESQDSFASEGLKFLKSTFS